MGRSTTCLGLFYDWLEVGNCSLEMRQEVKPHPHSVFINLCIILSTVMQFHWSTNCVLLTPRHQPGNKSLMSSYYQPWMFTLWSGSSENTLLEIVSPFQMNPPTHRFFKCSWTKPEDVPLISSPAFKYNFTIQFGLNLSSLASPKLRRWIL